MIGLLALSASLAFGQTSPLKRSLWTWHGDQLLTDPTASQKFFRFLQAPKGDSNHKISVIFFAFDPTNPGLNKSLRKFIANVHRDSIRIDFLCGDANYVRANQMSKAFKLVSQIIEYNKTAPPESRFDGFQYDVEPYLLPDWPKPELRSGYLKLLGDTHRDIQSSGSNLALGAAIPRWFDATNLDNLYKEVLDRVDYVAVMDYVDNPASFVNDAANIVKYASASGKQAWLGAEASELPTEPMATFYAKGNAAMEAAFDKASASYGPSKGFAGVAIEYYETYDALRP